MKRSAILVPSEGPQSWKNFLAQPDKQWRTGYSAKTLAHCWEESDGIPAEVLRLLPPNAMPLIIIPEHKVILPGGARESQNDIFMLAKAGEETISITIEGKVNEPFGPLVKDWMSTATDGKIIRLNFLCEKLNISPAHVQHLRYQLLHRTVSAILEMERFGTTSSAMFLFPMDMWLDDFTSLMCWD